MASLSFTLWLMVYYLVTCRASGESHSTRVVYNITCDSKSEEECQSESLETIAKKVKKQMDVQIDIKTPQLQLNTTVNFTKLNSLRINGEPGSTNITCRADGNIGAGIVLSGINDTISLNNLNLTSCGSRVHHNHTFISALTILHCRNVELNGLVIARSRGIGLTLLIHKGGRVNVISTVFKENKLPQEYIDTAEQLYGGGGVYIVLKQFSEDLYSPMIFLFQSCTFENNIAHTKHYKLRYTDVPGEMQNRYGSGGGAHLSIGRGLVSMSFLGCQFVGNQAFAGGGLAVEIVGKSDHVHKTNNVTVQIKDSQFKDNGCGENNTVYGGGTALAFLDRLSISNNHYLMINVSFTNNCAELGGGVSYYSYRERPESSNGVNSMLFDNCTFKQNEAHTGSAVSMTPDLFLKQSSTYVAIPTFQNCQFLNNNVSDKYFQSHVTQTIPGIGTVYASLYNIDFHGYNIFLNNLGSAMHIVNGIVNFQNSSVSFINNTGLQGGAVALIGSSTMIVGPNSYEFIGNKATFQGGAVYVSLNDITDFTVSKSCFIQYTDNDSVISSIEWDANITFWGNKAKDGTAGHAIFASSLHPCQFINNATKGHSDYKTVNTSTIFTIRGVTFDDSVALQPQIATDGALLNISWPTLERIIPGEKYRHGITMTDELGQRVRPSFRVAINRERIVEDGVKLDPAFSSFIGDEIQLTGKADQNVTLYLETLSPRKGYIQLAVQLLSCPPGFKPNNLSECVCNTQNHFALLRCDENSFHSYLLPGHWAGVIESKLVSSVCPFCDYNSGTTETEVVLPRSYAELSRVVCGETRTGIVCGRCQDNYTVHFHSPGFQCKLSAEPAGCKLGWLFYILSELVPITAVFITVLVFNISFTSGAVNGFILFSQLLDTLDIYASGIIVFPDTRLKRAPLGYQVLYRFINLDFFNTESLSFCLWKDASALDMIAFKYVTILYTVLLVVTVIWIMNKCGGRCLGKLCRITAIRTSVIHGISTFLVIGYAQCIKVSISLIFRVRIHAEHNSDFRPQARVWFNGELVYFSKEHLPYALPALFCLFTVGLLPPALLLTYPLLNKVLALLGLENHKVISLISGVLPISSLKPLLDSFQGCFKDNMRFFAGLYFLYRCSFLLVYMNIWDLSVYYTAVGGILLFILAVHTICQPYIKRAHNIIDTLLFSNLILINSLSLFNYQKSRNVKPQDRVIVSPVIIQLLLLYLPLAVMSVYLFFILCELIIRHGYKNQTVAEVFIPEGATKLREMIRSISAQDDNSDSKEEDFTHDRLMDEDVEFRSTCTYFEEEELENMQLVSYS